MEWPELRRCGRESTKWGADAGSVSVARRQVLAEKVQRVAVVRDLEGTVGSLDSPEQAGQTGRHGRRSGQYWRPNFAHIPVQLLVPGVVSALSV